MRPRVRKVNQRRRARVRDDDIICAQVAVQDAALVQHLQVAAQRRPARASACKYGRTLIYNPNGLPLGGTQFADLRHGRAAVRHDKDRESATPRREDAEDAGDDAALQTRQPAVYRGLV